MTVTIKLTVEGEERDIFINFVPETGLGKDCAIKQYQRSTNFSPSATYSKLVLVS